MKGVVSLGVFALFYLLIIILFQGQPVFSATAQQRAVPDPTQSKPSDVNPLADLFQIADPDMRTALGAIYGSVNGNDQCSRKAFCMLGNYMKNMPGRDLIFYMMGQYIPSELNLYYEIFKMAVLYGQNCEVYVCIPNNTPTDAASAAARPPNSDSNPTTTSTTSKPSQQQQQQHQQHQGNSIDLEKPFPKSPSLSNSFPR